MISEPHPTLSLLFCEWRWVANCKSYTVYVGVGLLGKQNHAATLKYKMEIKLAISHNHSAWTPGAGIIEADDRQVTTVFTVQQSFHHRHSTNRLS